MFNPTLQLNLLSSSRLDGYEISTVTSNRSRSLVDEEQNSRKPAVNPRRKSEGPYIVKMIRPQEANDVNVYSARHKSKFLHEYEGRPSAICDIGG